MPPCAGVTDAGLKPRPIKRVAVLGGEAWVAAGAEGEHSGSAAALPSCACACCAVHPLLALLICRLACSPHRITGGLMGSGIATACILNGIDVVLKEVNQKFLDVSAGAGVSWGGTHWCALPPERNGKLARGAARVNLLTALSRALPAPEPLCPFHHLHPWVLALYLQAGMGRIQANLASRVKKGRMSEAAAKAAMARVKVGGRPPLCPRQPRSARICAALATCDCRAPGTLCLFCRG